MHQGRAAAMSAVTPRFQTTPDPPRGRGLEALAVGLGWFSIALGLAELLMTRSVARASGMQGHEPLLRLYGAREIAQGIGILLARDRTPWLMARVAGDVLDLATLGAARNPRAAAAMLVVGGATALDLAATRAVKRNRRRQQPHFDYSGRSGFPKPAADMRGVARNFKERRAAHRMGGAPGAPQERVPSNLGAG